MILGLKSQAFWGFPFKKPTSQEVEEGPEDYFASFSIKEAHSRREGEAPSLGVGVWSFSATKGGL